jgi:hypothetical protein
MILSKEEVTVKALPRHTVWILRPTAHIRAAVTESKGLCEVSIAD